MTIDKAAVLKEILRRYRFVERLQGMTAFVHGDYSFSPTYWEGSLSTTIRETVERAHSILSGHRMLLNALAARTGEDKERVIIEYLSKASSHFPDDISDIKDSADPRRQDENLLLAALRSYRAHPNGPYSDTFQYLDKGSELVRTGLEEEINARMRASDKRASAESYDDDRNDYVRGLKHAR